MINELNSVLLTSAPVDGKKKTIELVVLHSSFDLLKKYAKTLTYEEVLSYSWRPINQSKSVFVWTCNVSFIISSGMLWKIYTNTLRFNLHWLESSRLSAYLDTGCDYEFLSEKERNTHTCTYSTSFQLKIHSLLRALCSLSLIISNKVLNHWQLFEL